MIKLNSNIKRLLLITWSSIIFLLLMNIYSFSLWLLYIHVLFSGLIFFYFFINLINSQQESFIFICKNLSFKFKDKDNKVLFFLVFYIFLDFVLELFFIIGFIFSVPILTNLLLFSKLGLFPFYYYSYLIYGFSFSNKYSIIILVKFIFINKLWGYCLFLKLPVSMEGVLLIIFVCLIFLLLSVKKELKSYVSRLMLLEGLFNLSMFCVLSPYIIYLYFFLSFFLYIKAFQVLINYEKKISIRKGLFCLSIISGNPLHVFVWFKFFTLSCLFNISFVLTILLICVYMQYLFIFLIYIMKMIRFRIQEEEGILILSEYGFKCSIFCLFLIIIIFIGWGLLGCYEEQEFLFDNSKKIVQFILYRDIDFVKEFTIKMIDHETGEIINEPRFFDNWILVNQLKMDYFYPPIIVGGEENSVQNLKYSFYGNDGIKAFDSYIHKLFIEALEKFRRS